MEDFRNKIKNYKATPNDQSWERMLIKNEKRGIKKMKTFLYLLFALNFSGLLFWTYQNFNSAKVEKAEIKEASINETQNSINETKESDKFNELTQLNEINQSTINSLRTENENIQNELRQLRKSLVLSKAKYTELLYERSTSITISKPSNAIAFSEPKNLKQETIIDKKESVDKITKVTPLYRNTNNYLQNYLIELASRNKTTIPYFYNETIINNEATRNWYASIGTKRENLIQEKQQSLVTGLHRSLNKYFDVGVLLEFSNASERGKYRVDSKVVDQKTETIGLFIIRYKALRFNKFLIHADAGIGYRFGNISNRQSRVVDNTLQYYNDAVKFRGVGYQFSLGIMYRITPRFDVGARFYLDGNLHNNINLNYRF